MEWLMVIELKTFFFPSSILPFFPFLLLFQQTTVSFSIGEPMNHDREVNEIIA